MPQGHESYRLNPRPLLLVLAAVVAVIVLALAAVWLLYQRYPPPRPALEWDGPTGAGAQSFETQLRVQQEYLQQYGWVDREHGIVHIPIEQAMELVLEQEGLGQSAASTGEAQ